MRIAIFGLGYVGCVSAARLAEAGHTVVGVDVNAEKVAMVNAGHSPIVEPGLDALLAAVVDDARLTATGSVDDAVRNTELALLCVGTPSRSNGAPDFGSLSRVCEQIGAALAGRSEPYTVVVRSTTLPGTLEGLAIPALCDGMGVARLPAHVHAAVNPEFMREGSALEDFLHPPMTLVGAAEAETAERIHSLYERVEAQFVHTQVRTAEMVKYAANAYHALKVCFTNEVAEVCDAFGADAQEVMRIFRMDRKLNVSEAYLRPGFAFGGSCLPKDIRALCHAAQDADVPLPLIGSILSSNTGKIRRAVDAVLATRRRRIGVVGLSFKPGTDDLRESPMVTLVEALIGKGCRLKVLDRNVAVARLMGANRRYIEEEIPHIASLMCDSAETLLDHAEVLVIGNAGEEAARVLAAAGPGQGVIDLTRTFHGEQRPPKSDEAQAPCIPSHPENASRQSSPASL